MKKNLFKNIIKTCLLLALIITISFIASCNKANDSIDNQVDNNDVVNTDTTRKVSYTVRYVIVDKNINEVKKNIKNKVNELNGYVQSSSDYDKGGNYVYQIPTSSLNSFLDYVDSLDNISNKVVDSNDITSSYSQIEERLKTLKASKQAYIALLAKDDLSMGEIISINNKIEDLDSEINTLEAQMAYYNNKVTYSQVTIVYNTINKDKFFIHYGSYLVNFFKVLFEIIMYSLPFAFVGAVVTFGIVFPSIKFSRKRQKNKTNNKDN